MLLGEPPPAGQQPGHRSGFLPGGDHESDRRVPAPAPGLDLSPVVAKTECQIS
jgi:hypothetical protein